MQNPNNLTLEMLAKRRKALGFKQSDVADLMGKSVRTISSWESGKAIPLLGPRDCKIFRICYGLSLEDLADVLEPEPEPVSAA